MLVKITNIFALGNISIFQEIKGTLLEIRSEEETLAQNKKNNWGKSLSYRAGSSNV